VKKGKNVKKESKQEIKPEIKVRAALHSYASWVSMLVLSPPRCPFGKRPGIVTRTQKKALEALGPLEDDGECWWMLLLISYSR
jgi:hypothetical protein